MNYSGQQIAAEINLITNSPEEKQLAIAAVQMDGMNVTEKDFKLTSEDITNTNKILVGLGVSLNNEGFENVPVVNQPQPKQPDLPGIGQEEFGFN